MTSDREPRIFSIRPGVPFAEAFARGFHERYAASSPTQIAHTKVLVNTRRTQRAIEDALADIAPGPTILPRMALIPELYMDPMLRPEIAPAVSPMRRKLYLTLLVERQLSNLRTEGSTAISMGAAGDLADTLGFLIDQFHDEGLELEKIGDALDADELNADAAEHWLEARKFIEIVGLHWARVLAESENGARDPRARQRQIVDALTTDWAAAPPVSPMIAAGSTGSVGSTADLMAAIACQPHGAVVLPGFDPEIEAEIWETAGPDHPVGPFQGLFRRLDLHPEDVEPWTNERANPRQHLMAQAMRPAPVTDHWFAQAEALKDTAEAALSDMSILSAPSPRQEAEALAIAVREHLEEPEVSIAVITPDASLARRLTAALDRFGIVADDSLGRPLGQTPPGVLCRMAAAFASGRGTTVDLAALLGHPLVRVGLGRGAHLNMARVFEREVLRKLQTDRLQALPDWPKATDEQAAWLSSVRTLLTPMQRMAGEPTTLGTIVQAHRILLEALSVDPETERPLIWDGPAGAELDRFFEDLADAAPVYGETPIPDYTSFLNGLLRSRQVRPDPALPHPRVAIWGPREARVLTADVLILAGLTDSVWPALPDPDPWLSRPMRTAIGLPAPERQIGLSAHDFMQAVCQPRVILSHAQRIDGSPVVPSRWLIRLENLVEGIGAKAALKAAKERGTRLLELAKALSAPVGTVRRAPRPSAKPPLAARPRGLSVTQLETLVRDAYAIYARHVLKLRPMDPLGAPLDARDRGNIMHTLLETFVQRTEVWPGSDVARAVLMEVADEVLSADVPVADLRRTWRARIDRFTDWFVTSEEARRQTVHQIVTERRGDLQLDLPGGPFKLSGTADRIDIAQDGTAAIFDYKTKAPTKPQIAKGFNQQLHVQGAIMEAGGFDGMANHIAKSGSFIGLTGSGAGGEETAIENLSDEIAIHMEHVSALLGTYDSGHPYVSLNAPERTSWGGDYDHLARRAEWDVEDAS